MSDALLRAVDCVQVSVRDIDEAIDFYRDRLGQPLVWRSDEAAGFAAAIGRWIAAGGNVEVEPFDIAIGRCAVVRDPFGNRLVIVDMSRGPLPSHSRD